MRTWLLVVTVVAACSKKAPPPPPGAVSGPNGEQCAALIPPQLRGGLDLEGSKLQKLGCTFKRDGAWVAHAAIDCSLGLSIADFTARKPPTGSAIAGLGRVSWLFLTVDTVDFYATKADCTVRVQSDVPHAIDTVAVAKAIDKALRPETAPAALQPPPGAAALNCDVYVPESIRNRAHAEARTSQTYVPSGAVECTWQKLEVLVECATDLDHTTQRFRDLRSPAAGTEHPTDVAVGRMAFVEGAHLSFVDGDTNCLVTITSYGLDPVEVAREIEPAITPQSIAK